jgi:hypothetical protein
MTLSGKGGRNWKFSPCSLTPAAAAAMVCFVNIPEGKSLRESAPVKRQKERERERETYGNDKTQPSGVYTSYIFIVQITGSKLFCSKSKTRELTCLKLTSDIQHSNTFLLLFTKCDSLMTYYVFRHTQVHAGHHYSTANTYTLHAQMDVTQCVHLESAKRPHYFHSTQCSTPHSVAMSLNKAHEQAGWGFRAAEHSG